MSAPERVILVGMDTGRGAGGLSVEESLEELAELVRTAGGDVLETVVQVRRSPDPATYVGSGKVEELAETCTARHIDLAVCDDELSPGQLRNLQDALEMRVVDRTQVILDIFAQRARTKEGKLQVELAQLNYYLPRLIGRGAQLSRLGGGIGTRGPGETKLEVDRRRIRRRIGDLRRELDKVRQQRSLQRRKRREGMVPVVALVGYTNAGKSTLLNRLTAAGVQAENQLFATLDPTARGIELPSGDRAILIDTVGFIQKLPHALVAAFRATLEEVTEADVLIHVVDAHHDRMMEQARAVFEVLEELGAAAKPTVVAYNKIDLLDDAEELQHLVDRTPNAVAISALKDRGMPELLRAVADAVPERLVTERFLVPYDRAEVVNYLHENGTVMDQSYVDEGVLLVVQLREHVTKRLESYRQG